MKKKRKVPPSVPYEDGLIERLKDPEYAVAFIKAAGEDYDEEHARLVLSFVAKAYCPNCALAAKEEG